MTTMDYELLHIANIGYKDRLDERDEELEKLRHKCVCELIFSNERSRPGRL